MWKRLIRLWSVVRSDARLLWHALRHPQAPLWLKVGCIGIVIYLLSPVDLIPDMIPVLGWVDDLLLIPWLMRQLIARLPLDILAWARERSGDDAKAGRTRRSVFIDRMR